ncbi:MAG: guanylate kinase [Streptosporangiales bacterium]|nr:guanylate kinase [Streptosporangiales bacterium]
MTDLAVVLYGPPAAGKDTVTRALAEIDARYRLFPRLKCGTGRTGGYRMITRAELGEIRGRPGEVIWENTRYSAVYVVDRSQVTRMLAAGQVPVLHLGQPEGVRAVVGSLPDVAVLVVGLECPRDVALERAAARGTGDLAERAAAYDATPPLHFADLTVDTSTTVPQDAAALIHQRTEASAPRRC